MSQAFGKNGNTFGQPNAASGRGFGGFYTTASQAHGTSDDIARRIEQENVLEYVAFFPDTHLVYCGLIGTDSDSLSGLSIDICVGEKDNQQTFSVHQNMLTTRSEFFKRATKEKWMDERRIPLPEDKPEIFRLYVNLLYTKDMATKGPEEWMTLCRMYILAEKLQDMITKNRVVDAMTSFLNENTKTGFGGFGATVEQRYEIGAESIEELYTHTPEGSPVRRLVADYYADNAKHDWLLKGKEILPADFFYDVAFRLLQKRPTDAMTVLMPRASFNYHEVSR